MKIAIHKVPEIDFIFKKSSNQHSETSESISLGVLWQELDKLRKDP